MVKMDAKLSVNNKINEYMFSVGFFLVLFIFFTEE